MELIPIIVGFDQREAIAYHVFCQSVLQRTSNPVIFQPLVESSLIDYHETHSDGSNKFVYSRFLTPFFRGYSGWAIFADGDMVCLDDIKNLWRLRDESKAVMVVKHSYKTKATVKYLGNRNEDYPRKNWSSLVLWNCGHPKNKVLTPQLIQDSNGAFLHRFSWLNDEDIGDLPIEWNWLAIEYPQNPNAKIVHFTLGTPCFKEYSDTSMSELWKEEFRNSLQGMT